ncbi:uncharacterized protein C8R40DRAFT_1165169 [Lentinula edodes]|uniref:uncharacterized protein n=1 Tax=Lentinula edodes TaxID=5353 RepID=UPI001E8E32AB|nr:uncharacterized protein C8R40DRAFT_1165169 [Lentinula edodes]KAH7880260.1 hypothetical protein C8R40DRAFT_1165169 [Lentinula edodes]
MNPYSNFDHRPLCADHKEINLPSETLSAVDHTTIAPSTGPTRTQKTSNRASPYSSPSPDPQLQQHRSPLSPSVSIESLSSELEYESDRERLAHLQRARQGSYVYGNNHHTPHSPKHSSDSSTSATNSLASHSPASVSMADDLAQAIDRSSKTVSAVPAKRRGPPALVFENDSDDDFLIPKPPGEVGRPNRGGYSLFDVLSWPRKKYDQVKKYINKLVDDHLDCEVPMSEQTAAKVKKVRELAVEKYPFLKEYSGLWAVDDFIRNHLKYQKSVLRKEKLEKIAAEASRAAEKRVERSHTRST